MRESAKILLLVFALMFCACERRPLYDPEDTAMLNVRLVTDNIHNVTCDIYNSNLEPPTITSDMLRVLIYEPGGTPILSQGFMSAKRIDENGYEVFRGPLSISAGTYKLLSYNFDLDVIQIEQDNDYNTIEAWTPKVPQYFYQRFGSRTDELGELYYPPEHLMVARAPELEIQQHTGVKNIELDAYTVVDTYYIQIRISGAQNMAQNANCQAVLSGISPSNCFGTNIRNCDEPASLYFEMQRNVDPNTPDGENENVLCAVFNTFGKIPDADSKLYITMSVLTRDGKTHQKVIDMTPVFNTEDARLHHWLLIDEEWEIPEPVVDTGDGGFTPSVEDWDDVTEVIPIGPRSVHN